MKAAPDAQVKICGHCMTPGSPTCCHERPPSSEACTYLYPVSGARNPQDACLHHGHPQQKSDRGGLPPIVTQKLKHPQASDVARMDQ